ncbi:MAG: ATP-binding protein [Gammaproteobacteria bacterium]|nr:ATP-binding protein [Gammaproteobacteria bacterium]
MNSQQESTENKISLTVSDEQTWRPLRLFNYYRLTLSLALLLLFYNASLGGFLGRYDPEAYLATALVFLISSGLYIFLGQKQTPAFTSQVIIANSTDILLISLMMHFSGGLTSPLGILLAINIAATGTFLQSRESYLFAALASIAILSEQTYSLLHNITTANAYSFAGVLGIVFFATSMLASTLSQRVKESEALAHQRTADLISLEKLNEHIIQNMRTGILVVDNDGHIRLANSSAEALLGNVPLQNNPLLENILPALDARFLEWQEQPQMHHKAIRQQQGLPDIQPGFRQLESSTYHSGDTLIFLEDATQLNQRFQQIKLASLGRLTASIAHEIRNPLSAINHAAQLLSESQLDDADSKLTGIITTQVQRLDKVIQNVLQLSRQEKSTPATINLFEWLTNFKQEFCASHELDNEQLEVDMTDKNIQILFDSSHLYQVISNLSTNAINHSDKPRTEVKIKLIAGFDNEQQQPYLDIIDNGPGIDLDLVQQIFDPFFTTSSKGTGLGLYISREILESNRAKIRYLETEQGGSCFRIHFLSSGK